MYVYYIIFKFLYLIIIYVFTINTTKSINSFLDPLIAHKG